MEIPQTNELCQLLSKKYGVIWIRGQFKTYEGEKLYIIVKTLDKASIKRWLSFYKHQMTADMKDNTGKNRDCLKTWVITK